MQHTKIAWFSFTICELLCVSFSFGWQNLFVIYWVTIREKKSWFRFGFRLWKLSDKLCCRIEIDFCHQTTITYYELFFSFSFRFESTAQKKRNNFWTNERIAFHARNHKNEHLTIFFFGLHAKAIESSVFLSIRWQWHVLLFVYVST